MISRNSRAVLVPVKLVVWLVVGMALAGILSGCQTSPSMGDNWPYHGPPMVGTNTIPVPKW